VQENGAAGDTEVWDAVAPTPGVYQVTATATVPGYPVVLEDVAYNNAAGIGAAQGFASPSGAPSGSIATTQSNSWVWGVGFDWLFAKRRTVGPGQKLFSQNLDWANNTHWVQSTASPTPTAGTTVTLNDTAPTSDPYDLALVEIVPANQKSVQCNDTTPCPLLLTGPNSTLLINADPNGGQLTGQIDPGTPMDGPGSDPNADPGCARYTPQNLDWYGFDVVNPGDGGPPGKTLTGTFQNATPAGYRICFGATSQFFVINSDGKPALAQSGALPDGSTGSVGFLPFCVQLGDLSGREPCITDDPLTTQPDPNSSTGEDVIVDVHIPAGFPGDPFMGRG